MRNAFKFLIVLTLATACHKELFMPMGINGECDCLEFDDGTPPSASPQLVDSAEFFVQLNDALYPTNKWEWFGSPTHFFDIDEIDSTGIFLRADQFQRTGSKATEKLLDDQVASLIPKWRPAYWLEDSTHKVSSVAYMHIRIHEDSILFSIEGREHRNLLRKNFTRPIVPIRKAVDGEVLVHHNGSSAYLIDGIEYRSVAPELIVDSAKFFRKVKRSLKFTNTFEWHGLIKGSMTTFSVDSSGKFRPNEKHTSQAMESQIDAVARTILRQAKHWKRAHLVPQPAYTVPYSVIITISVDEKNVHFRMYGEGDKDILKKDFRRPL